MNPGGVPIARLFGVEIRMSFAWAVLAAIVTVLGADQAAFGDPSISPVAQWATGALVAVLFLVSVIAHELAHALVGRRRGVPATSITLGFVGGLAPLTIQAPTPRDELLISVVGPLLSLGVAVVLLAVGLVAGSASEAIAPLAGGLIVVGALNALLGVLSFVPAMPLDGGRVVRALAWARSNDRSAASRTTARVGRMVGWTIIGIGVALALADFVTEGLVGIALGWLLTTGARTLERRIALEDLLRGVRVSDAMQRDVGWIGPHLTVDTFADRFEGPDAVSALPVVEHDQVLGVIGRRRLVRLGRRRFGGTRAADVMATPPLAPLLAPTDALWDAVDVLNSGLLDGLAVTEQGRLAGLLTRDAVADAIRARAAAQATTPR